MDQHIPDTMLACACDFQFIRATAAIPAFQLSSFPEMDINIPLLPSMIAYVQMAMPHDRLNEMKLSGRRVTATELAQDHVIEAACPDATAMFEAVRACAESFKKCRPILRSASTACTSISST